MDSLDQILFDGKSFGGLLSTEEMDQLMDVAEEIAKTVEKKPKQIEEENGKSI